MMRIISPFPRDLEGPFQRVREIETNMIIWAYRVYLGREEKGVRGRTTYSKGSEPNRNHSYCGLQCYCCVYTSEFWPTNYSFTQRGYRVATGLQYDVTSTGEHPRLPPVRCVGLPTLLELPRCWSRPNFFLKSYAMKCALSVVPLLQLGSSSAVVGFSSTCIRPLKLASDCSPFLFGDEYASHHPGFCLRLSKAELLD